MCPAQSLPGCGAPWTGALGLLQHRSFSCARTLCSCSRPCGEGKGKCSRLDLIRMDRMQDDDVVLLEAPEDHPEWMLGAEVTDDGRCQGSGRGMSIVCA